MIEERIAIRMLCVVLNSLNRGLYAWRSRPLALCSACPLSARIPAPTNGSSEARSGPAPHGREEPGSSDLGAVRKRESILHVDAKIAHGVLDLGMAEQNLHSA